jgi:hypothetical protein
METVRRNVRYKFTFALRAEDDSVLRESGDFRKRSQIAVTVGSSSFSLTLFISNQNYSDSIS